MIIEVRKRGADYHAQIQGHPQVWGCGRNESEAIGDLVRAHPESFNLRVITNPERLQDKSNYTAGK